MKTAQTDFFNLLEVLEIVELALIGIVMLLLVFSNHDIDPFNKSIQRQRSISAPTA